MQDRSQKNIYTIVNDFTVHTKLVKLIKNDSTLGKHQNKVMLS